MRRPSRFEPQWSVTMVLIVLNVIVFIAQEVAEFKNVDWVDKYFVLSVAGLKAGYVWQLITFQFLHGNIFHILSNMFVIYFLGHAVEEAVGKLNYLKLYMLSGVFGGLVQMGFGIMAPAHFGTAGVVGASAGGFGIIAAFATLFPDRPLYLFFLPFEFRARILLWFGLAVSVIGMLVPAKAGAVGVAHCAHLGGIIAGLVYIRWLTHAQKPLVLWQPFRAKTPRRELVKVRSQKPQTWQRPKPAEPEELPPAEFITKEVDPILDKISAHGIQSLTARERQILEAARAKMSKR